MVSESVVVRQSARADFVALELDPVVTRFGASGSDPAVTQSVALGFVPAGMRFVV